MEYVIGQKVFCHLANNVEEVGIVKSFEDATEDGERLPRFYANAYFEGIDKTLRIRNNSERDYLGDGVWAGPLWKSKMIREQFVQYDENSEFSEPEMGPIMPLAYTTDDDGNEVQVFRDLIFDYRCISYKGDIIQAIPAPVSLYEFGTMSFSDSANAALWQILQYEPKTVKLSDTSRASLRGNKYVQYQVCFSIDEIVHLENVYIVGTEFGAYIVDPNGIATIRPNAYRSVIDSITKGLNIE